ncbi:MAG: hypothetical protein HYW69_03095 [Candidatus Nealsonbacteria bacterium]|nr:hypothetical protein [Candidatus Nealsonbacteria bacterium]
MKILKKIVIGILIVIFIFLGYFFVGKTEPAKEVDWGVNFSQKYAKLLGLDWQEAYSAIIADLGARNIKILTSWDLIEPKMGEYSFNDLDWQIGLAEEKRVSVLLVIGNKTGRWPECHMPDWAKGLSKEAQQDKILKLIENIVLRYKGLAPTPNFGVGAWQVENEALFPFGECPWRDKSFLKKEISLVKSLDPTRPVIVSDSGEFSFWITAAQLGDIASATLHRKVWFKEIKNYITYPLRPIFYWRKAQIIKIFFNKEVIVGELQAEPWCPNFVSPCSLEEQKKTMDLPQFQKNIQFAKETGLNTFYLWGPEWMFWMKEKQNKPEIWEEAKKLFK